MRRSPCINNKWTLGLTMRTIICLYQYIFIGWPFAVSQSYNRENYIIPAIFNHMHTTYKASSFEIRHGRYMLAIHVVISCVVLLKNRVTSLGLFYCILHGMLWNFIKNIKLYVAPRKTFYIVDFNLGLYYFTIIQKQSQTWYFTWIIQIKTYSCTLMCIL